MANGEEKFTKTIVPRMRQNPWILSTIFLSIILLFVLVSRSGLLTGNVISEDAAAQNLNDFAKAQKITLSDITTTDEGSFYVASFTINGTKSSAYITKDGKYLIQPMAALTGQATASDSSASSGADAAPTIPKSDKPKVDLYIFSYCPFGTQAEKGMIPVYNLLKNKVDFNIIAIGAMHGDFEKVESLRQISIEKLYGKDKLFAYLQEFDTNSNIGSCGGDATCLDKYLPAIYTKLGIDKSKVDDYMKTSAEAIYSAQGQQAASLGYTSSPTLVINNVEIGTSSDYKNYIYNDKKIPFSRSAETYKTIICDLFNKKPSECSTSLSTSSPSPGFGGSTGASTGASCG